MGGRGGREATDGSPVGNALVIEVVLDVAVVDVLLAAVVVVEEEEEPVLVEAVVGRAGGAGIGGIGGGGSPNLAL